MARLIVALACAVAALTACVPTRPGPTTTSTVVSTVIRTRPPSSSTSTTAGPTFVPPPARTVAPLPPGQSPAAGEVEKSCPYIASSDATPSVADIIGSHVLRTTVVTTSTPVGCRFYFYSGAYQAIADILPRRFASPAAARDAVAGTAAAGAEAIEAPDLVPGVDAMLYRTKFFGPDGALDWACAFSVGRTLVVVHSQSDNTSFSVRTLAAAVAPKFQ